jgi:hypothetical protein
MVSNSTENVEEPKFVPALAGTTTLPISLMPTKFDPQLMIETLFHDWATSSKTALAFVLI